MDEYAPKRRVELILDTVVPNKGCAVGGLALITAEALEGTNPDAVLLVESGQHDAAKDIANRIRANVSLCNLCNGKPADIAEERSCARPLQSFIISNNN